MFVRRQAGIGLLLLWWLTGCALQPQPQEAAYRLPQPLFVSEEQRWWCSGIRMPMSEQRALWHLDTLLADRVFKPALSAEAQSISVWRFHRRAADDATGHQFSFWFYADAQTAERVFAQVEESSLLTGLHKAGYVQTLINDCAPSDAHTLQATSDPIWDERLQRSWPYFIMGASMHWLALIEDVSAGLPQPGNDPDALLAHYQQVNQEIAGIWQQQGRHAYLHHLTALFGYQPLLIRF